MSLTAAKLEAKRGLVVLLLRTHFHLLIVTQLCPEHTLGVLKSLNFESFVKQKKKIANRRRRLVFSTYPGVTELLFCHESLEKERDRIVIRPFDNLVQPS